MLRNPKEKGVRLERKAKKMLEAEGYYMIIKMCPFLKSKCVERECMGWDEREFSLGCKLFDIPLELACLYEQLLQIRRLLEKNARNKISRI